MPQFRILIAATLDAEFDAASMAAGQYVRAIRHNPVAPAGTRVRDVRVLKVEDVSPPSLEIPEARGGVSTEASV